jgi:hypothetical protein
MYSTHKPTRVQRARPQVLDTASSLLTIRLPSTNKACNGSPFVVQQLDRLLCLHPRRRDSRSPAVRLPLGPPPYTIPTLQP